MKRVLNRLLFAFGFLTITPGLGKIKIDADEMGKSSIFFPVVGLVVGACVYGVSQIQRLSPLTIAVLVCIIILIITRGIHADGVLDTFDGFLSGKRDRKAIIAIMKDSRVGALGFISAFCIYILKISIVYEVLIHIPKNSLSFLFIPPVLSRGGVPFYSFLFGRRASGRVPGRSRAGGQEARAYETLTGDPGGKGPDGKEHVEKGDFGGNACGNEIAESEPGAVHPGKGLGKSFAGSIRLPHVLFTFFLMELFCFRPENLFTLLFAPLVLLFWLLWGMVCIKKIGGITGDTIGAGIELAEIVGFVLILVFFL